MITAIVQAIDSNSVAAPASGAPTDRSARTIAAVIGRLITAGTIESGAKLPTVRQLSKQLGVSPTTVSEAWRGLAAAGAIETRGRNGTFVRSSGMPGTQLRYRRISAGSGQYELDLSSGIPDVELLPVLGPIVARVSRQSLTSSYLDNPVLPELAERLAADWPFETESLTVVDGALDALDRVGQIVLRLGDRVVVEDPCFPPMLDLLDRLGCEVIGVPLDDDGIELDGLRAALELDPAALIVQPRAQNPSSRAMSRRRAAAIAKLLAERRVTVIEDDHANDISSAPLVSLGSHLPERTIHIRSFSKSHGPDLRLAAVGGAGEIVQSLNTRRMLGPGWSSRILQAVLLELLDDPGTADVLEHARSVYAARRRLISTRLADAGIEHPNGDGINLWMTVDNEQSALLSLASRGIGAAPGTPFIVAAASDVAHLRVTAGLVPDARLGEIADRLVEAALTEHANSGQR